MRGIGFKDTPPNHLIYEDENPENLNLLYHFISKEIKEFRNQHKKQKQTQENKKFEMEEERKREMEEKFVCQRKENESKNLGPSKNILKDKSSNGITRYENIGVNLNKGG